MTTTVKKDKTRHALEESKKALEGWCQDLGIPKNSLIEHHVVNTALELVTLDLKNADKDALRKHYRDISSAHHPDMISMDMVKSVTLIGASLATRRQELHKEINFTGKDGKPYHIPYIRGEEELTKEAEFIATEAALNALKKPAARRRTHRPTTRTTR